MLLQNRIVVTIHFTIKDEHGQVLESTDNDKPFSYLEGTGYLPQVIETAVNARKIGEEFLLSLSPEEAYGYPDNKLVKEVSLKDIVSNNSLVQAGAYIDLGDNDGYDWVVCKKEDDKVFVNANHPWAGKRITIQIKIINRRPALNAEINKGIAFSEDMATNACGPNCCC